MEKIDFYHKMQKLEVDSSPSFKCPSAVLCQISTNIEEINKKDEYLDILKSKDKGLTLSNWIVVSHKYCFICLAFGKGIFVMYYFL